MFKHRFNPEKAHNFRSVIDAVDLITARSTSTLNLLNSYLEGDCTELGNLDIANVIYGVLADLEDVHEVLNAHFRATLVAL